MSSTFSIDERENKDRLVSPIADRLCDSNKQILDESNILYEIKVTKKIEKVLTLLIWSHLHCFRGSIRIQCFLHTLAVNDVLFHFQMQVQKFHGRE